MFVVGRRAAVVVAVWVALCGLLVQRVDTSSQTLSADGFGAASLVSVEPAPVAVAASGGTRVFLDGALVMRAGPVKVAVSGKALLVAGIAALTVGFRRRRSRPDRRVGPPMQRSVLAPLRAPPAFV